MASYKCPYCGSYSGIPIEKLGPGCVGTPALIAGAIGSTIARLVPHDAPTGNLVVVLLAVGTVIVLGIFLWFRVSRYPLKCEQCGYVSRGGKLRDR